MGLFRRGRSLLKLGGGLRDCCCRPLDPPVVSCLCYLDVDFCDLEVRINSTSASVCNDLKDPQPAIFPPGGGFFVHTYSARPVENYGEKGSIFPGFLGAGIWLRRYYSKVEEINGESVDVDFFIFCGNQAGATPCATNADGANPTYHIAARLSFSRQVTLRVSDIPKIEDVYNASLYCELFPTEVYTRCASDSIGSDRCCNAGSLFSDLRPPSIDATTVSLDGVVVSVGGESFNLPWTSVVPNPIYHELCVEYTGGVSVPIPCIEEYLKPSSDSVGVTTFGLVDTAGCGPCECTADIVGRVVLFEGKQFTVGNLSSFTGTASDHDGPVVWTEVSTGQFQRIDYEPCEGETIVARISSATVACSTFTEAGTEKVRWYATMLRTCYDRAPGSCEYSFGATSDSGWSGFFSCGSDGGPVGGVSDIGVDYSFTSGSPQYDCAGALTPPSIQFAG